MVYKTAGRSTRHRNRIGGQWICLTFEVDITYGKLARQNKRHTEIVNVIKIKYRNYN